ncbi:hypothetical protein NIBR502770_05525 [Pseudarthrobacter sp. NIBRBAC000502770]|nr:hypothetical protein NIBR502771_17370 [Pseudarthrobacter sp. NIBRBAC000502771]QDG88007.1 hypothetical protein NIBR502770_05525 [Pseudarthrobacter sp. NIBRBAC000502770]
MNDYSTGGAVWFAIALINAGLAEQKNRSRIVWFLISVFIGPFATLLIVVLPPPKPVPKVSYGQARRQ